MQLSLLTVELTNVKNIYIYIYILNIDKSNLKKQHVHALMLMHAPERQSTCGCGGALTSSRASSYHRWNVRLPQPTTEVFNAGERAMHIMCSMKGITERKSLHVLGVSGCPWAFNCLTVSLFCYTWYVFHFSFSSINLF